MKKVIILRGPSGCGKTSWAGKNHSSAFLVSTDDFWLNARGTQGSRIATKYPLVCKDGYWYEYIFDPFKLPEAHARCMEEFLLTLGRRETIIVDNTNITTWQYKNYELAAKQAKYEVEIVEWQPIFIEDIRICARRSQHRVPIEVIAKMCFEFEPSPGATVMKIEETK